MSDKYLDPKNDVAFKRLFGSEKNKDLLITLLNNVLHNQLRAPVKDVSFLSPIQDPEALAKKQSIVDVLCQDTEAAQYIIEMQVASVAGFEERAQYYAYKAFVSQMQEGGKYQTLQEVIFLAFTDFVMFPNKVAYKSEHMTLDKKTGEQDLDKVSFTFIELPKFDRLLEQSKRSVADLTLEEKFYYFLKHAPETDPADIPRIAGQDKVIGKAYEELRSGRWSKQEAAFYEAEQKRVWDNAAVLLAAQQAGEQKGFKKGKKAGEAVGIQKGRQEGEAVGLQKGEMLGIQKGRQEGEAVGLQKGEMLGLQKVILGMRKAGAQLDFIQKSTGLSEEEIKKILQATE